MQRSEKVKRRKGKRASTESLPPPSLSVSINANNRRLMSHSYLTTSNGKMPVCTCVLSVYFQGHRAEFHTVQNSSRVRQMAAYPDPPPVIPVPDTGVAEVTSLPSPRSLGEPRPNRLSSVPGSASDPKCFQVLGLSPSLLQNPML